MRARIRHRLSSGLLLASLWLTGCSSLPMIGPLDIPTPAEEDTAAEDAARYEVIDIDAPALVALQDYKPPSFSEGFTQKSVPATRVVAAGDELVVNIWEAAAGGLFHDTIATQGSNGAQLTAIPTQTVDSAGNIRIPYAGTLPVAGLTTQQVAELIETRLQGIAIKPQVLVTIVNGAGAWASVVGDVTGAARVPLNPQGDRLLDVIASAGGIKAMPFETRVRLTRGDVTETVSLDAILHRPRENVYVYPGDQIYVYRAPATYVALGAVESQKDYPIDQERFTLAQAVAKAGGLIGAQANPSAVFLFRYEPTDIMQKLRPNSRFLTPTTVSMASPESGAAPSAAASPAPSATSPTMDGAIPVIYRIDFRKPESFFIAQQMQIRPNDLVYVGDASSVQFNKFLLILRNLASIYGALRINSLLTN